MRYAIRGPYGLILDELGRVIRFWTEKDAQDYMSNEGLDEPKYRYFVEELGERDED